MKQLLILSGKGGTGKTTVASSFIHLLSAKAYADCDVDAPNLHLMFTSGKTLVTEEEYYAMPSAMVDTEKCVGCMACAEYCKFGAISTKNGHAYVDVMRCEGCKVCTLVCPMDAIEMRSLPAGDVSLYRDGDATFVTAELRTGSGTSGKLVSTVKKTLIKNAIAGDIAVIDGSPGIGCPVIASLSGASLVLIVTEPTESGMSDMERLVDVARGFGVEVAVCVNKYDLNVNKTRDIERYCEEHGLHFVGKIPYDNEAVRAINGLKSVVEIDCRAGDAVREIYEKTIKYL